MITNFKIKNFRYAINQQGSILLIVIIFILLSGMIMTYIFKIYFSSIEIIKNHKINKSEINTFLSPKNKIENKLSLYPKKINKNKIDFNNILKNGVYCPIKNIVKKDKIFTSDRFCEISNINNLYIGNLISKKNIIFPFPLLVSSGNIFLEHELIITEDTTILSLGDIEILNIIGEDASKNYSLFLQSETNNITIKHASNIKTLSSPFITLPSYKQNVFAIKF